VRILAALIASAVLLGCGGREEAAPAPAPVRVGGDAGAVAPDEGPARYVGVVVAVEAADLAPRFAGELIEVKVRAGDTVAAGDLVARVDPRLLREELTVAEAALGTARALLRQADVDVADAERRIAIEQRAVASGTSAADRLEQARFDLERAGAARSRARAAAAEERARVDNARSRLADAEIRAPFAGSVAIRYRDPGAVVGPSAPILRLIGGGALSVRFAVPPAVAAALKPGAHATVNVDTIAAAFTATITQVSPELDTASNLIFVEADLDKTEAAPDLSPGLPAWVRLAP
jgi:RND family efflux transporter MFP subunit